VSQLDYSMFDIKSVGAHAREDPVPRVTRNSDFCNDSSIRSQIRLVFSHGKLILYRKQMIFPPDAFIVSAIFTNLGVSQSVMLCGDALA